MGILDLDQTLSAKQAREKTKIVIQMTSSFKNLVINYNRVYDLFWNNPVLTPQQVADAFGAEAVALVSLNLATAQFINAIQANTINPNPPTGFTITPNQDGTVTVTGP